MVDFQIKIAGAAGEGVMAVGLLLAKALSRAGFFVFNYNEYPSLIRGGHNTSLIRVSDREIGSIRQNIEVLVALNSESFKLHEDELTSGGILLWDQEEENQHICKRSLHCLKVPLREIARSFGNPMFLNTIALGALAASLNLPLEFINQALKSEFSRKGAVVVAANQKAAKRGFDFIRQNYQGKLPVDLAGEMKGKESKEGQELVVITGNEACALGAIAADCRFFAGYPMTPSTGIFHTLAELGPKVGLIFKQTEDEISAINMAIGASYAGRRSMTATSGGGFALMTESVGLAAMTETPLVLVEAMRPGPATGLPTWTEQSDLRQVLHAGQGEFPRLILTPGDSNEALRLTYLAFQIADEYQIPVIVLTDKYLAESSMSTSWPKQNEIRNHYFSITKKAAKNYQRYKITETGISPRLIPGVKEVTFIANSDEHTQEGFSSEKSENRRIMQEKRWRKIEHLSAHLPKPVVYGDLKPKVSLYGFGSTKWPIREAVDILIGKKIKARAVHLPVCWPLPDVSLAHYLSSSEQNFIIENNFTGQLEGLIRQETGDVFDDYLRKYDGRPFLAEEIVTLVIKKV